MLLVLAWIIFIIAAGWNFTLLLGIVICWYKRDPLDWKVKDTVVTLIGMIAFVAPGVYLFGVW